MLRVPVVPHFMDDWATMLYRGPNPLLWFPRQRLIAALSKLLLLAPLGIAISQPMAEEYSQRYGIPFATFMNAVEVPELPPLFSPSLAQCAVFTLAYVGGTHFGRFDQLIRVCEAVANLRKRGLMAEVIWYDGPPVEGQVRAWTIAGVLRIGGPLPEVGGLAQLQQADCLLHLESFESSVRKIARLSISSKIPFYLATGRPILAWGPSDQVSIRYLQDNECAVIVEKEDQTGIVEALYGLFHDDERRKRVGGNGWRLAHLRHERRMQRHRLHEILLQVSGNRLGTASGLARPGVRAV